MTGLEPGVWYQKRLLYLRTVPQPPLLLCSLTLVTGFWHFKRKGLVWLNRHGHVSAPLTTESMTKYRDLAPFLFGTFVITFASFFVVFWVIHLSFGKLYRTPRRLGRLIAVLGHFSFLLGQIVNIFKRNSLLLCYLTNLRRLIDVLGDLLQLGVTRLGDFLHFGQPFKASCNNYSTQIAHVVSQFL